MKNGGDFLDELLQKKSLNDEEKVSILLDLLLAGYETTSGLMSLVVYFLAQAPSSLQNLRVRTGFSISYRILILI